MPHVINVGHDVLLDFATAVVDLEPAAPFVPGQLAALQLLFRSLEWRYVQNGLVQALTPVVTISTIVRNPAALNDIRLQLVSTASMTVGDKLSVGTVDTTIAAIEQGNIVRMSDAAGHADCVGHNCFGDAFRRRASPPCASLNR